MTVLFQKCGRGKFRLLLVSGSVTWRRFRYIKIRADALVFITSRSHVFDSNLSRCRLLLKFFCRGAFFATLGSSSFCNSACWESLRQYCQSRTKTNANITLLMIFKQKTAVQDTKNPLKCSSGSNNQRLNGVRRLPGHTRLHPCFLSIVQVRPKPFPFSHQFRHLPHLLRHP